MKPTVFYFDFYNEDTETSIVKGFNINADIGGDAFIDDAMYDEITQAIETDYGIHDWSSSPSEEVYGIGYTSYEIRPKLIDIVMEKWRDEFVDRVGESVVTAVVTIGDISNKTDHEIYQEIQQLTQ